MGCCLSRPKDENKKSFTEYNTTEGSLHPILKNELDSEDMIDTHQIGGLLKGSYNSLKLKNDDSILEEDDDDDLPTFNYRATTRKEENLFLIDDLIENRMLNNSTIMNNSINNDYSLEEVSQEDYPLNLMTTQMTCKNTNDGQNININNINNANYFSMNSNSIVGNFYSKYNEDSRSEMFNLNDNRLSLNNVFTKKNFVFLYFEIKDFIFWAREYIISLYPEVNLVMIIEINDSKLTQEKITFSRSKEDKNELNKYSPLKKKDDAKSNCYRILHVFEVNENDLDMPFKICITFYTFTNHKLISICSDEFFIKYMREGEMQKYKMYQNMYMKHYNKKIGNLMFNFSFKSLEIYPIELEFEKLKKLEDFSKFEEEQGLNFIYYGIENYFIKENGNSDNSKQRYFSIRDIEEIEIAEELNGEIRIDRLLELLLIVKKKFEFYHILKKINNFFPTKEFKEDKLINFKEILQQRLEEFSEKKEQTDKILIPYIFTLMKKAFFKIRSSNGMKMRNSKRPSNKDTKNYSSNSSNNSSNSQLQKKEDTEKLQLKNVKLLTKFFQISFQFLRVDIIEDISLASLNYIFKYFEESLVLNVNGKTTSSDEFFFDYLVDNKLYTKFCDMILKYYEYQACVQPIFSILAKIVRYKKNQCQELIEFFNTEKFQEILRLIIRIHDCNSVIMMNIFSTLYNLIDFINIDNLIYIIPIHRLKEVFNIFKMTGFDLIHETIIHLVKGILLKKTEKKSGGKKNENDVVNISDEEYSDIIIIFSLALSLIRNKILMLDFFKLSKWVYTVMTHLYTISHIINNTNPKNLTNVINIIIDKKIVDYLVDCFAALAEKKIFIGIDNAFEILDLNLINIKIMIFRTVFHCVSLIRTLKEINSNCLTPLSAEKLIRILKMIEDHDLIYNPNELFKSIERHTGTKSKVDQQTQNLLLLHRNLQDYYNRYKTKAPEFLKDFMSVIVKNKK